MNTAGPRNLAPIEPSVAYPLADFQARTGLGTAGLRTARKNGLRIIYRHRRGFVLGSDFIAYLNATQEQQQEAPAHA